MAANAFFVRREHFALHECYVTGTDQRDETTQHVEICSSLRAPGASRLKAEKGVVKAYAGEATYTDCTLAAPCNTLRLPPLARFKHLFCKIDAEGHDFLIMNKHSHEVALAHADPKKRKRKLVFQPSFCSQLLQFDVITSEYFGAENRPTVHEEFCA